MSDCPACGEPLLPSQEWQLRADVPVGSLETEDDIEEPYVHVWCDDRFALVADNGPGEDQ